MKTRRIIYYFLFLAITLGGFASMAQNNYGLPLISFICFVFAVLMLLDLFVKDDLRGVEKLELFGLSILSILFGLRASYIHIPYIEWLVIVDCLLLMIVYGLKAHTNYGSISINKSFFLLLVSFYSGLVLLLASMAIRLFSPQLSQLLGGAGFGLLIGFAIGQIVIRWKLVDGKETTLLKYVRKQSPYSMILATAFMMISIYAGLALVHILPPLYTDKVPPTYLELVSKAEYGEEKAVSGTFEHDRYKDAYDAFVEKNK